MIHPRDILLTLEHAFLTTMRIKTENIRDLNGKLDQLYKHYDDLESRFSQQLHFNINTGLNQIVFTHLNHKYTWEKLYDLSLAELSKRIKYYEAKLREVLKDQ